MDPYVFDYSRPDGLHMFIDFLQNPSKFDVNKNSSDCIRLLAYLFDVSFPINSSTIWKASLPPHPLSAEEKDLALKLSSHLSFV